MSSPALANVVPEITSTPRNRGNPAIEKKGSTLFASKLTGTPWEEVVSSLRTVLGVTEKVLGVLPFNGPKAIIGSLEECLRVLEVRAGGRSTEHDSSTSNPQLKWLNKASGTDLLTQLRRFESILQRFAREEEQGNNAFSVSADLRKRVDDLKKFVTCYYLSDTCI